MVAFNWNNLHYQRFLKIFALIVKKNYDNILKASRTLANEESMQDKSPQKRLFKSKHTKKFKRGIFLSKL